MLTRRLLPTSLLAALALAVVPAAAGAAVEAADDIADAPSTSGSGFTMVYDTDGASTESGEPTHVAGTGGSVWLKWTAAKDGNMQLNFCDYKPVGYHLKVYKQKQPGTDSVTNIEVVPPVLKECDGAHQVIAAKALQTYYIAIVRSTLYLPPNPEGTVYLSQRTTPPVASFTKAPKVTGKSATFEFTSEPKTAAKWECKLDGADKACNGAVSFLFGKSGEHELTVRAIDDHLNEGPVASWKFRVDMDAPDTFIDSAPPTSGAPAAVKFHATADDGVQFKCQYDAVVKNPCVSGWQTPPAGEGPHKITVTAYDKYGNVDATPAVQSFTVAPPLAPVQPEPEQPAAPQEQPAGEQPAPEQPSTAAQQPEQPVVQAAQEQPVAPPQPAPLQPCRARFLRGRVTKRGAVVRVTGDPARGCTVSLKLVKGRRVLARKTVLVEPGAARRLAVRPKRRLRTTSGVKLRIAAR
ncbi:MAG TPA: hypothetical protein VF529_23150 [Solirubrobacteraceae bacterium]|jgi:hypothetical protein